MFIHCSHLFALGVFLCNKLCTKIERIKFVEFIIERYAVTEMKPYQVSDTQKFMLFWVQ